MSARELAARWSRLDVPTRERQLAELRSRDGALATEVAALRKQLLIRVEARLKSQGCGDNGSYGLRRG